MAHLFLSGARIPRGSLRNPPPGSKTRKDRPHPHPHHGAIISTRVPHKDRVQLTAAPDGTDMSWYRCTGPFGAVVLVSGVVLTAVAFAFHPHGSPMSVLGLVLLSAGLGLLGCGALCWRLRQRKTRPDRRRESQAALVASQGYCMA